jgi:hypothetical protein
MAKRTYHEGPSDGSDENQDRSKLVKIGASAAAVLVAASAMVGLAGCKGNPAGAEPGTGIEQPDGNPTDIGDEETNNPAPETEGGDPFNGKHYDRFIDATKDIKDYYDSILGPGQWQPNVYGNEATKYEILDSNGHLLAKYQYRFDEGSDNSGTVNILQALASS